METAYKLVREVKKGEYTSLIAKGKCRCHYQLHKWTKALPGTVGILCLSTSLKLVDLLTLLSKSPENTKLFLCESRKKGIEIKSLPSLDYILIFDPELATLSYNELVKKDSSWNGIIIHPPKNTVAYPSVRLVKEIQITLFSGVGK